MSNPLEIATWKRELLDDLIRCTPPDGAFGEIVIHDRVAPIQRLSAHVAARVPAKAIAEAPIHLVTAEGEYASLVHFEVEGAFRTLGVIFGDDFQTIIEARTTFTAQRERFARAAREIVTQLPLGLGRQRTRRFKYKAPAGWNGTSRGLTTTWRPTDATATSIKVFPARPLDETLTRDTFFRDESFDGFDLAAIERTNLLLPLLRGTLARATNATRVLVTAALENNEYVYVLRLSTTPERLTTDEATFTDLVYSCIPLPVHVA
ncbi:MAG TPA: hypothetical protein VGC41_17865, partial [Kofleriaceae bacterium]